MLHPCEQPCPRVLADQFPGWWAEWIVHPKEARLRSCRGPTHAEGGTSAETAGSLHGTTDLTGVGHLAAGANAERAIKLEHPAVPI